MFSIKPFENKTVWKCNPANRLPPAPPAVAQAAIFAYGIISVCFKFEQIHD